MRFIWTTITIQENQWFFKCYFLSVGLATHPRCRRLKFLGFTGGFLGGVSLAGKRRKKKRQAAKRTLAAVVLLCTSILACCQLGVVNDAADSVPAGSILVEAAENAVKLLQESWEQIFPASRQGAVSLEEVPEYAGSPFVEVNGNVPEFDENDLSEEAFERYSALDFLGRCGVAYANIGLELMPTEERESLSGVTPSGWKNKKYDNIEQGYLYNRCHLIGFQLAGENANERNLITGTRYLNVDGMLPLENMVADYIQNTGNHVLYRVTPVFDGDDLVASGVQIEAQSVEDDGAGVRFNVYCYNVQPGIVLDYATGES